MTSPLRFPQGLTLVGGGTVLPGDLAEALALAPALVAADGGADRALAAGLMPDAVIGDLDSISDAGRAAIAPDRLIRVAEQDSTDFEKCLSRVDAPFALALGFAGGRIDHALAAMTALVRHDGFPVLLLSRDDLVFRAPERLSLDLPAGTRLSLFPMGPARGRSSGLRWPIDGLKLAPDARIGTSNQVTGPVVLDIDGPMLVILPRPLLGCVLACVLAQLP